VKSDLKPASSKARTLLRKLEALAERGVDGEKLAAQRKLVRLKARFNFDAPDPTETPDLFQGTFKRSSKARRVCSFSPAEFDVASQVKWAIESATGIRCLFRDRDLMAEAASSTANRLAEIALHIAQSFRTLVAKFSGLDGVSVADRGVFIMGLYDGMMNDPRQAGQPLPGRPGKRKRARSKTPPPTRATGLHLHPYELAVSLGRQIRFSVPLQQIAAELDGLPQRQLAGDAASAPRAARGRDV